MVRTLLLLLPAIALTGCSWLFVDGPPARPTSADRQQCTTSKVAPAIDSVVVAFQVLRVGFAAAADDSVYADFPISREADMAIGVGLAALFTASAVHGFSATSRCATAQRQADRTKTRAGWALCTRDTQCRYGRICDRGVCMDPAPMPQSPPAPAPPPAGVVEGAAGYTFGMSVDAAAKVCTDASGAWTGRAPEAFECSAAAGAFGPGVSASVKFCGGALCEIDVRHAPEVATLPAWMRRYDGILRALRAQYGNPVSQERTLANHCASLPECLAASATSLQAHWKWSDGRSVWLHSSHEDDFIHVTSAVTSTLPPPQSEPPTGGTVPPPSP